MPVLPILSSDRDSPGSVRAVTSEEAGTLALPSLSEHFDPFLVHFVKEAIRCRAEVWVMQRGTAIDGLLLHHSPEGIASVFARERRVAEILFSMCQQVSVYSDFELSTGSERYWVYSADSGSESPNRRFAHPVRAVEPADRGAILSLMRAVYGSVDEVWFETTPADLEAGFLVEGDEEIAGVAWATVVDGFGRLHSLSVRPRYRRTGIATDLWHARMAWARRMGAGRVVTEIAESNLPSRTIAEAGGMRVAGTIYRSSRRP